VPINFNNTYPTTLDEAIDIVVDSLDDDEREYIRTEGKNEPPLEFTRPDGTVQKIPVPYTLHHGFGTALRNGWHLWDFRTPLVKYFAETYGICFADDISGMILEGVERKIRGKRYTIFSRIADANRYKRHWRKNKIDPMAEYRTQTA
jgi:hypothetical protein